MPRQPFPDGNYGFDDDWDEGYGRGYEEGPRRHRPRMSTHYTTGGDGFLGPEIHGARLHRSRSTGQRPSPYVINIHNDMEQGAHAHNSSRERSHSRGPRYSPQAQFVPVNVGMPTYMAPPPPPPPPPVQQPIYMAPPPAQPIYHRHHHSRSRSRSRSRSSGHSPSRADREYYQRLAQLEELKRKEKEAADRLARENDIAEYERNKEKAAAELREKVRLAEIAEAQKREKEKHDREDSIRKWKADEDARRAAREAEIAKWQAEEEARKKKAKADQEEAVRKWQEEEEAKKKKAKQEQEEAVRKWKQEEEEKKEKKKKEEEEYKERVRRDLSKFGLRENQIDAIVDHEEKKKTKSTTEITNQIAIFGRPTYPKVHRKHISIETLKYYDLPWEYDRLDGDYIIILKEMSERETDILFEHTKRLKTKTVLTIEDRGRHDKPEYAWVRKRSKSRGKSPSNRERFAEMLIRR